MKTLEQLRDEMYDCGLAGRFDALAPFAKNAVRISLDVCNEEDIPVGSSKFGGCPDLPPDTDWFRMDIVDIPMSFLAQVNLAEVAPFDTEHKLPGQGMLYFFYDCSADGMVWGFEPEDADGWKVIYYDGDLSLLTRREAPEDLEEDENGILFGAARMCFESCMEIPSLESDLCRGMVFSEEEDGELHWEWGDEDCKEETNKLLGHADPIQGGMELECEYVTHRINCGSPEGYQLGKQKNLDKNASHWNLLLQIESNEELGMMWGDLGRLYFWITDEDLAERNFENCWMILQCG